MIEMIRIELINDSLTSRARSDEWIDFDILTEVGGSLGTHLVSVVLTHDAFPGDRVIGSANLREQQQTHVMHLECGQNDERGGLFYFTSALIDVKNTGRDLARVIKQNFGDVGVGTDFQIGAALQDRQN